VCSGSHVFTSCKTKPNGERCTTYKWFSFNFQRLNQRKIPNEISLVCHLFLLDSNEIKLREKLLLKRIVQLKTKKKERLSSNNIGPHSLSLIELSKYLLF